MPAVSKQREFEILRSVLALAEERGDGVALADAARAVGVDEPTLRRLLDPVLFLAFHTRDEMVDESWAFLLTEDARLIVTEDHWLRTLASEPPDGDTALRLLVAGLAMQSAATGATPDLDRAVDKLRDAVAAGLQVSVPAPACLDVAQTAWRDGRSLRFRYLADPATTPSKREVLPHGVFCTWGHWYVSGRELAGSDVKQFRLDRMTDVALGDVEFDPPLVAEIPAWFDLAASERTVRLRCTPGQLDAIPRPAAVVVVGEVGDGRVEADVTISGDRRLDWVLVALDPSTEVVSPPEAVVRRRDHARALLDRLDG
jgi:predicted DNA-binding transcriptional regulator YafY